MGSNDRVDGGSSEWEEKEVRVKEAGRNVGKLDRLNVTGGDDVTETFECSPKASLMMVLSTSPESLRVYLHDDDQESVVTDEGRGAMDRSGQAESSRETMSIISVDERSTLEKEMEVEALRKFRISYPMSSTSTADDDDRLDLVEEAVVTPQTTVEEGLMLTVEGDCEEPSPTAAAAAVTPLFPSQSSSFKDNSKRSNKKRWVLLLLLFIVVASVIVLGVFLANKTTEKEDEADKALGVYTPPEAPFSSRTPSTMPSNAPEYNPSPPLTMTTSLSAFSSEIPTYNPLPQPISSQYQQITGPIASSSPTEMPVCEVNYDDFNLCIAIDMSGSGESQA